MQKKSYPHLKKADRILQKKEQETYYRMEQIIITRQCSAFNLMNVFR